jgi:hypothetical protein
MDFLQHQGFGLIDLSEAENPNPADYSSVRYCEHPKTRPLLHEPRQKHPSIFHGHLILISPEPC